MNKIVRYLISGVVSTAVNLALTWVLERVGMHYIAVVTVAFASSVVVSFALQKFFTFRNKTLSGAQVQFAVFVLIAGVNLAINDALVYVQYDILRFKHLVFAQAIASAVIAVYSYFIYRYLFSDRRAAQVATPFDEQP